MAPPETPDPRASQTEEHEEPNPETVESANEGATDPPDLPCQVVFEVRGYGRLEASPLPVEEEDMWEVSFTGRLSSPAMNELINELYDNLFRTQGIVPEEIGIPLRGTTGAAIERGLDRIYKLLEDMKP